MKVLIMSDSHGWTEKVAEVIDRHKDEVEGFIHCGDSELEASASMFEKVSVVRGNCDMDSQLPEERTEDINDLRFFVAHGHLLNVKSTEMNLIYKAQETESDVVCFGHTHMPTAIQEKGTILINPGSMRLPRQYPEGTYVILEKNEESVHVSFRDMKGRERADLTKTFSLNG
ncbi:metallophosphoesterase family protein [Alkalicoccus halolimnae]|uniref:Phosphoesterase n=1 Tax=Alkalicoccus halolimnae TaxID=1667239 RepID=A0A5C7F8A7_9BACI|nr:metallophosphoesterase [Alkalicoccus halolimnae]TXF85800.1 metallophosphoesterase [Alkalicoccus halolimnae]